MHLASKSAFWLALLAIVATACAAGQVKSVGIDSFPVALASNEFVLVNFYAKWCPFSRKMQPIYESVSAEFSSSVAFTQVDVDEQKALAKQEHVAAVPTLRLYRHGALMAVYRGPQEAGALSAWIKNHAVSISNLSGCSARAARKANKPLIVGFYKNMVNPSISSVEIDTHSALLGALSRAVGEKAFIVEHNEKERTLSKEIGATSAGSPLFALIDWVPSAKSRSGFMLRARFFDEKTPLNADSLVAWASKLLEPAQEQETKSSLQILSVENFEAIVNNNDKDVLIAFVDKTRVEEGTRLMQAVAAKIGTVKTLDITLVNVDAVPRSEVLMKEHVGSKIVPSVWVFPAGNKNSISIAIVSMRDADLAVSRDMLVTFTRESVTHSFELPKSNEGDNGNTEKKPDTYRAPQTKWKWRDVVNVLLKWLAVYWLEL